MFRPHPHAHVPRFQAHAYTGGPQLQAAPRQPAGHRSTGTATKLRSKDRPRVHGPHGQHAIESKRAREETRAQPERVLSSTSICADNSDRLGNWLQSIASSLSNSWRLTSS